MGWDDCRTGPDQRQMPLLAGPRPLWSPPAGMSAPGLVPVVPPDLAGLLHQRSGQHPWCEGGHHHSSWPAARDDDAGQTTRRPHHRAAAPRALRAVTVPTSITGTAGLTLDFTVVHPVGRSGTEYAWIRNSQEAGRSQAKPVLIHQRKRIGPRDLKGTHVGPLPLK